MERKKEEWKEHLKILQEVLVSLLVLSIVFLAITMKTLSSFADTNMALNGSGRTISGKGKENFLIHSTEISPHNE
tara:strand:+ start:4028 stop:4252 length:225 start_codon:yes stop_codon:yes gene_type:complete